MCLIHWCVNCCHTHADSMSCRMKYLGISRPKFSAHGSYKRVSTLKQFKNTRVFLTGRPRPFPKNMHGKLLAVKFKQFPRCLFSELLLSLIRALSLWKNCVFCIVRLDEHKLSATEDSEKLSDARSDEHRWFSLIRFSYSVPCLLGCYLNSSIMPALNPTKCFCSRQPLAFQCW